VDGVCAGETRKDSSSNKSRKKLAVAWSCQQGMVPLCLCGAVLWSGHSCLLLLTLHLFSLIVTRL